MSKPSDLAVVVAALASRRQWVSADEIRWGLAQLGFKVSTQQVAAWLRRMVREDCPAFEVRRNWAEGGIGGNDYAVTQYGRTWVHGWIRP